MMTTPRTTSDRLASNALAAPVLRRIVHLALALSAICACAAPGRASGDWLVLRDGARLKTRGPWKVKGPVLVFSLPDGTLSSLRASEVDLEASARATHEAETATKKADDDAEATPPPVEPEERAPVLILTDADVRHYYPENVESGEQGEEESEARRAAPGQRLTVTQWQEADEAEAQDLVITGTLENVSEYAATVIKLTLLLFGREGDLLESQNAQLSGTTLRPGQSAEFRATFSGRPGYAEIRFQAESVPLEFQQRSVTPPRLQT